MSVPNTWAPTIATTPPMTQGQAPGKVAIKAASRVESITAANS